ncbi:hypothetical protein GJ496_004133 [Pomphorhynchus laevis]|nr:hypothetical protein GJ496_004133 [Pomphorhynchus laevis]
MFCIDKHKNANSDLLFTFLKGSQTFEKHLLSPIISKLVVNLKPRYHFCSGGDIYFEAPPYRNYRVAQQKEMHVTRFVALASSFAAKDQKGMYGFQITPMMSLNTASLLVGNPQAIESPYTFISLNPNNTTLPAVTTNYFFEQQHPVQLQTTQSSYSVIPPQLLTVPSHQSSMHNDRSTNCDIMNAPCWFCPGEPHYESHLVVSVGQEVYMSLARGGLTDNHVMIVPIEHIRSTRECSTSMLTEIKRYKNAITEFFDKEYDNVPVFFERFLKTVHFQIQCIPIPKSKIEVTEQVFVEYLDQLNLQYEYINAKSHLAKIIDENTAFFLVDIPNGKRLFVRLVEGGLHLQFGRIVLASDRILNITNRGFNWKLCLRSQNDEAEIVSQLRESFSPYDPGSSFEN